jgi:uncharacterized membrane protein YphA (DoxX/SURF4 family)
MRTVNHKSNVSPVHDVKDGSAGERSTAAAVRLFWLKQLVVAGLLVGLLSSIRLWTSDRRFPRAPLMANLPELPAPAETLLFVLLLGLLAAIAVLPRPRRLYLAVVAVAAIFALFDQMRWQPWFYQYVAMLATLGACASSGVAARRPDAVLNTSRLIVASIYFYSGLQKANPRFFGTVFPWLIEPFERLLPASLYGSLHHLAPMVPILEMGVAILLLTRRFRPLGVVLALVMLVFNLYTLGPAGHHWNSVVWPWNIAMAALAIALFWRANDVRFRDVIWNQGFSFHKVVLVLFGVMPALGLANLWDSYLSFSLYAGNSNRATIRVSEKVFRRLLEGAARHATLVDVDRWEIDFQLWSLDELNVPHYPETRVYKQIARALCQYADQPSDVELTVHGKPTLINRGREATYHCGEL